MNRLFKVSFWSACLVVAILSLLPTEYLSSTAFDWWDKAQHAVAFGALGCLGFFAYQAKSVQVGLGLLVYGALIELAQATTGWRYGEWQDWLADTVGVGLAYIGWQAWLKGSFYLLKPPD